MGAYNEELSRAGVLLAGEGLHPSSKGARVRFADKTRAVVNGPFVESKELIAGFWLIQARDLAEALEWPSASRSTRMKSRSGRSSTPRTSGPALTPELQTQYDRLREESKTRGGY